MHLAGMKTNTKLGWPNLNSVRM